MKLSLGRIIIAIREYKVDTLQLRKVGSIQVGLSGISLFIQKRLEEDFTHGVR